MQHFQNFLPLNFSQKARSYFHEQDQSRRRNSEKAKVLPLLNPLTPELNPSEQCCLPEFFIGDLNFNIYYQKKKAYLIDFSFKFNEIKFCTLLMNWLIQEKMFTYFYNKFRHVNCMYYIKCGVNSSLLT